MPSPFSSLYDFMLWGPGLTGERSQLSLQLISFSIHEAPPSGGPCNLCTWRGVAPSPQEE